MYSGKLIKTKKIKLVELADLIINDLHITRNDVVMVNISTPDINIFDAKPEDFIHLLKMIVGTNGTLLMPTYSDSRQHHLNYGQSEDGKDFDIHADPIRELFRKLPDTFQSSLPSESFAAWGKLAKKITENHQKGEPFIEKNDLFYKLSLFNVIMVGVGVATTDTFISHYMYGLSDFMKSKTPDELSGFFTADEYRVLNKRGIHLFRVQTTKVYNKITALSGGRIVS